MTLLFEQIHKGLSPRVRGKRVINVAIIVNAGSITACAGETFKSTVYAVLSKVYHRVCGGN